MNPIQELFTEIEHHNQLTAHASLIMEAKKEYASLLKKTDYAFALYMTVDIVDGAPKIVGDEYDTLDTLKVVTALHWFDDVYEPSSDEHLLNVTESKEFKDIKESGYYYFFQSGEVEPDISRDWESGLEELDGWIFEEKFTVCVKIGSLQ